MGATAVGFHGFTRPSMGPSGKESEKPDFDFWYNPTYDNYYRLLKAIEDLGVDISRYKAEKSRKPKKSFFRFELAECSIDFLPALASPIHFRKAFLTKEVIILQQGEIPFVGLTELLTDKQYNQRKKDLTDIEMLRKIKEEEEP